MAKDRARPFSRKHRRYWIPVTGGMILIGALNVTIGYCSYEPAPETVERIEIDLSRDAGTSPVDGGSGRGIDGSVVTPHPPQ